MGGVSVKDAGAPADLLSLIGRAIEQLQKSISLFESAPQQGVDQLAAVIADIDRYVKSADDDPLLRLAGLPPQGVRDGLLHVREDLASIVTDASPQNSPSNGTD